MLWVPGEPWLLKAFLCNGLKQGWSADCSIFMPIHTESLSRCSGRGERELLKREFIQGTKASTSAPIMLPWDFKKIILFQQMGLRVHLVIGKAPPAKCWLHMHPVLKEWSSFNFICCSVSPLTLSTEKNLRNFYFFPHLISQIICSYVHKNGEVSHKSILFLCGRWGLDGVGSGS